MNGQMQDEHPGTEELARRLDAYAQARLSPDRFTVVRMRNHVVEAAHARDRAATPGWRLLPLRRRLSALALAATLTVAAVAGVSAAAMPGGPLYGPRLWLQQIALPADANSRAQERLSEIDQRLSDADAATRAHDADGVAAALAAYGDAVEDAIRDAGGDAGRLAQLEAILSGQLEHLQELRATIPAQSDAALTRAIERASDALDQVETEQGATPTTTPKPGHTGQPSGGEATPRPGHTPAPNPTPKPARASDASTSPTHP